MSSRRRLFLVAVSVHAAVAFPNFLGCERVIDVGETIMSAPAVADTRREWIIERDGVEVPCGSTYVPGETLNARIDDASGLRYVMELRSGGLFDQSQGGCSGSLCDGTRCARGDGSTVPDGTGNPVVANTDGADLILRGAWASGFGAVNVIEDCVLTVAANAPATPTPTTGAPVSLATAAPIAQPTAAPVALLPVTNDTVPPYAIITNGTCASFGMIDILDVDECRLVMNDGYYGTRDQDGNGVLDAYQDYPIPFVTDLPPGCWPVEPGTPGFTTFPFACITPLEDATGECSDNFPCFCKLPEYEIITEGTCVSHGMTDILDVDLCRAVMDDGYYSTRDQDNDGIIDAYQDYPIPFVTGLPPGCWPVEPGTPGFTTFPFACITPLEDADGDCSANFPCFCLTDAGAAGEPEPTVAVPSVPEPDFAYHVVKDGTCESHGMADILDVDECRLAMNHGYYNTRDQDDDGLIDAFQDYPIPVVRDLPPGCWPVEPGTPGFDTFPFACVTPLEDAVGECSENFPCFCKLPEYTIITESTCEAMGYKDILDVEACRGVMNDGYYNTRDQDGNGVVDSEQDYPVPIVRDLPPGCWPVEPGTPGFDTFPFACVTPLEDAVGDCSDNFPCFCNVEPQSGGSSSKKSKGGLSTGELVGVIVAGVAAFLVIGALVGVAVAKRSAKANAQGEAAAKVVEIPPAAAAAAAKKSPPGEEEPQGEAKEAQV